MLLSNTMKIGSKIRIKKNINSLETGIENNILQKLKGREGLIVGYDKYMDCYILDICSYGWREEWIELISENHYRKKVV